MIFCISLIRGAFLLMLLVAQASKLVLKAVLSIDLLWVTFYIDDI